MLLDNDIVHTTLNYVTYVGDSVIFRFLKSQLDSSLAVGSIDTRAGDL